MACQELLNVHQTEVPETLMRVDGFAAPGSRVIVDARGVSRHKRHLPHVTVEADPLRIRALFLPQLLFRFINLHPFRPLRERQKLPQLRSAIHLDGRLHMGRVWRRAKRPATGRRKKPKQQAWGAIDLGSHSLRVAYTPKPGAPPEVLQLGVKSDPDGAEVPSFACPTNVYFPPESVTKEPEWKLLWYDSVKYPGRTSPGVKQSLDDRLSQPGTQGAHFRDLAAKDPNVSWDVVLELFKFVKRHIDERQIKLDRVNITVPAIQTRGSDGYEIQKTLRVYARSAGFSNVDFDSEPGAIAAWLAWKETSHGDASRWVCEGGSLWLWRK